MFYNLELLLSNLFYFNLQLYILFKKIKHLFENNK